MVPHATVDIEDTFWKKLREYFRIILMLRAYDGWKWITLPDSVEIPAPVSTSTLVLLRKKSSSFLISSFCAGSCVGTNWLLTNHRSWLYVDLDLLASNRLTIDNISSPKNEFKALKIQKRLKMNLNN